MAAIYHVGSENESQSSAFVTHYLSHCGRLLDLVEKIDNIFVVKYLFFRKNIKGPYRKLLYIYANTQ